MAYGDSLEESLTAVRTAIHEILTSGQTLSITGPTGKAMNRGNLAELRKMEHELKREISDANRITRGPMRVRMRGVGQ